MSNASDKPSTPCPSLGAVGVLTVTSSMLWRTGLPSSNPKMLWLICMSDELVPGYEYLLVSGVNTPE